MKLEKILVPLDGSLLAEAALAPAMELADFSGARLFLLRAAQARTLPGVDPTEAEVKVVREAEAYLDEVKARLAKRSAIDVEATVWYGLASVAIVEAAEFHGVSLILMTTHGRTGLERLILGSVAESVLRGTRTPILLLRAEGALLDTPAGRAEAHVPATDDDDTCRLAEAVVSAGARGRSGEAWTAHHAAATMAPEMESVQRTGRSAGWPGRPVVAVVDDDASIREALESLLRSVGFRIQAYASPEEFLRSECARQTQCLILDLHMPGMTGLDLQDHLGRAHWRLPIVVLTAHADAQTRARTLAAGAVAFLTKPVDEGSLLDALGLALGSGDGPGGDPGRRSP